jgi:tyrosyl-tRNA synthetase
MSAEQIDRLTWGCTNVLKREELLEKLKSGRPLRVKYGIDPTGIDVHLGHTVPLRKLRLFQELGHQAVLIIGNYTALVGDPSGRDQTRARLTEEQVEANARDYLKQVARVIDISRAEVRYNGEWFSKLSFLDVMALTGRITVQRMLERDDFTRRLKSEVPISLHECLYPLMQGHDSVEVRSDVELGGTEQLFNLTMGRRLQEIAGQPPQVCMTLPILRGLDGERRMGKSLGNYIGISMPAEEQVARVMSIPDALMPEWFSLLTDRSPEEYTALIAANPMEAKKALGVEIASFYHGPEAARAAREAWERRFSQKQDPEAIPEADLPAGLVQDGKLPAFALVKALGLAPSNNEARRLVQGGGVTVGPERAKLTDPAALVEVATGLVVRVGSRKIVRVRVV